MSRGQEKDRYIHVTYNIISLKVLTLYEILSTCKSGTCVHVGTTKHKLP